MKQLKNLLAGAVLACTAISANAAFVGAREDFRDETIYFAMTTRFYDGDPTNNVCGWDHQNVQIEHNDPDWRGDFAGLIERLDYIKALGFTAIWITPVVQNCSGTDFHGYHAMDFSKVDLRYESRTAWGADRDVTFQSLIDAAHAKGIKIILDIVLNHTGNFGEAHFAPLFTRSNDIRNQASVKYSIIPDASKLGADYNDVDGKEQYNRRFPYLKNTLGKNLDTHNYWHHIGTEWNWDLPNRWWGQIAGDCVDLNTENPAVSEYLVQCYGEFIKMGVDGFRIDTTGHISRLTFNKSFIPQFHAIAEQYKDRRLGGAPFYMFGECCARFSDVTYRDQPNLSSYFYTWKSPESLLAQWNDDAGWWDQQVLMEGCSPVGNMLLCNEEPSDQPTSNNAFMVNGAWHQPDYSRASGFNIIDFPMHYNFNNAAAAVNVAKQGDKYYNDATYNVVYVDSHDYCPGPNDGTRFNGGTQQWAENLSLMFTFRGIPCIYYGTEVEFQAGKKVDAGGTEMPVSESGRAYFGHYLEGNVNASDFGTYTASGNVAQTLGADLAQHIIRLNQIRSAVPALRKGQYTMDGCTANGGWAFKRAYRDSYALVAINGGATFTGVPAGTYTDLVTGQTYQGGGTITVDAPHTKGQLRVLVKDWTGAKVGTDGKFIYASAPVDGTGTPRFTDPGASRYYTADDAVGPAAVKFNPAGGAFRTDELTVTATLNESAVSGWYKIGDGARTALGAGENKTFTIGADMEYGSTVTVSWGASDSAGQELTGSVTYKKVDPNASITVYVKCATTFSFYSWGKNSAGADVEPTGAWPGRTLTDTREVGGETFYYHTFDDMETVNFICSHNGAQTADITGIDADAFFEYDGATNITRLEGFTPTNSPKVTVSPAGGSFWDDEITVTLRANSATRSAWYAIGNGAHVDFTGTTTVTIGAGMNVGESCTISWSATGDTETTTGNVTFTKIARPSGLTVYYDNSETNWSIVNIYYWVAADCSWPGIAMEQIEPNIWRYTVPTGAENMIFNGNGNGALQSVDVNGIQANHLYKGVPNGNSPANITDMGEYTSGVDAPMLDADAAPEYYNLQGIRVENPGHGIYIERRGSAVRKVRF